MTTHTMQQRVFRPTLLALSISAALLPPALALDLSQAPPGTVQPYVRPNVIISIDDSGSMGYRLDSESRSKVSSRTEPDLPNGGWSANSKRINVLKYALKSIFDPTHAQYDNTLLPDDKIRLAWQVMHDNGKANAKSVDSGDNPSSLNTNSMRPFAGAHRTNFLSFVNGLSANGGTPSHLMFSQADAYMRRPLSKNGPWSGNPGGTDKAATTYLGCRRNYHILMTDGRWNGTASGGSQDDNTKNLTLPDGTVYGSTISSNRPNNSLYSDSYSNTLADWAFKSWALPLRTDLAGKPEPAADYRKAPSTESFGTDSASKAAVLSKYWNPKYDPADWPHMVTYTIGFSAMAYTWPGEPAIAAPTEMVPFGYDGSFPDLVTGTKLWPKMDSENKRSLDLWHAALNGRGRFYAVEKGEDLAKAFRDIFQQINSQTDPEMTATATSGNNSMRNDVGRFIGAYEPKNAWKGFVSAQTVKSDGTMGGPPAAWGGKNTAAKLDEMTLSNRQVISWSNEWSGSKDKGGVAFKWATGQTYLSTGQKAWLGLNPGAPGITVKTNGENILNYVRGERSLEGSESSGYTAAKPFRERYSRQGDIVNSVIWYAGAPVSNFALRGYSDFAKNNKDREPMLYVGGNDGMLHGFSAKDGTEKIAYVPQAAIPSLKSLAEPTFNSNHRYFVDGSPMVGDIDLASSAVADTADGYSANWKSYLVSTLGGGGKGYFVLDVTDPNAFSDSNAATLAVLDRTQSSEASAKPVCGVMTGAQKTACDMAEIENRDIGYIIAEPVRDNENPMRTTQITRLNNNRWAVVLGNGYNSDNQRPVLLVQYLDGDKKLLRIPVTSDAQGSGLAQDNGLAAPALVDVNGDGKPDVVYAGDNQGNLWKFDMTNVDDAHWKVAFSGAPLFTATGPASFNSARSLKQPIFAPPIVRPNDRLKTVGSGTSQTAVRVGGMMVAFGTGRNVAKDDQKSNAVQTLYSVLDNTRYRTVTTSLGKRLQVHPGGGTCSPVPKEDCAPTPAALGEGVSTAKLAKRSIVDDSKTFQAIKKEEDLDWSVNNGWYLDLPATGERLLKPMSFYDGSNILTMYSQVPAKGSDADPNVESCDTISVDEERQYRTFINIMDGAAPSVPLMDYAGDGKFAMAGYNGEARKQVAKGAHNIVTTGKYRNKDVDAKGNSEDLARMPMQSMRPSWRQLK